MSGFDKKSLDYLLRVSSFYNKGDSDSNRVIESHIMGEYLWKSGSELNELPIIDKSTFLKVCRWCLITWKSGMCKVYIEPAKHKGKSIKKLLNKKTDSLNKFQRKLAKTCRKHDNCNYLVVMCRVCHKKSKLPMNKPEIGNTIDSVDEVIENVQKKKKKKKKDLFAGLNPKIISKLQANSAKIEDSKVNATTVKTNDSTVSVVPKMRNFRTSNNLQQKGIIKISTKKSKLKIKQILDENKINAIGAGNNKKKPQKVSLLSSFLDSL